MSGDGKAGGCAVQYAMQVLLLPGQKAYCSGSRPEDGQFWQSQMGKSSEIL